jgi:hypothetical protein
MSTVKLKQPVDLPTEVEQALAVLGQAGFFDDGLLVGSWAMPFYRKLIIAQRRKKESKKLKDLEQCSVLAPYLDSGKLKKLAGSYTMSKTIIQNIKRSCDAIGNPAGFLE